MAGKQRKPADDRSLTVAGVTYGLRDRDFNTVKDKLETVVARQWVCKGRIGLRAAQRAIATDWQALYKRVFGVAPSG